MNVTCYCKGTCKGRCRVVLPGRCFSAVELVAHGKKMREKRTYGCFGSLVTALFQCNGSLSPKGTHRNVSCCNDSDFCNLHLVPQIVHPPQSLEVAGPHLQEPLSKTHLALILHMTAITYVVIIISMLLIFFFCQEHVKPYFYALLAKIWGRTSDPPKVENLDCEETSSGAGLAQLRELTVGLEIKLKGPIGKGKYGDVFLGERKEELVAVKFFSTVNECSWKKEKNIYEHLRHNENILGFKASDIMWMSGEPKMVLVTEYHKLGSLYDYLKENTVDLPVMYRMGLSIISGLFYLHEEITGETRKPSIAHRDLKTKNILLKNSSGHCCIADFGLAIQDVGDLRSAVGASPMVGTKRYTAPEVLNLKINVDWIESFKRADIYSFSLVLWEIINRCCFAAEGVINQKDTEYQVPFYDTVPTEPTFEQMREVVCDRNIRPVIPQEWHSHKVLCKLCRIMEECWKPNPAARLPALRIKKDLIKMKLP